MNSRPCLKSVLFSGRSIVLTKSYGFLGCAICFLLGHFASAQSLVDPWFNPGTGPNDAIFAMQPLKDGKMLIAGSFTQFDGTARSRIARLTASGGVDLSFDPGIGPNATVRSMVIQADGKILISGDFSSVAGVARNFVARLNANGSLDTSFAPSPSPNYEAYALALQIDQKILIGGRFTPHDWWYNPCFARMNPDGTQDYGDDIIGAPDYSFRGSANNTVVSISLQPDRKILLGGIFTSVSSSNGSYPRNRLARFNADGTVDTTFTPGTGANDALGAIAVQADGKIVIGGWFTNFNGTSQPYYTRLNSDGSLDDGFVAGQGANSTVVAIAIQSDQKILLGGYFTSLDGVLALGVARLNTNGIRDTSFGPYLDASGVQSIAIQPDNKILIAGQFQSIDGISRRGIARLFPDRAPQATLSPSSASVVAGSNYGLTVWASGPGPFTVQWQKDGLDIPGATNMLNNWESILNLPNVQPVDAGEYSAVVRNFAGSVTSSASSLTVLIPPTISSQPFSFSVASGETVTNTVRAQGSPPFYYQWYKDGNLLSGATDQNLILSNVHTNDAGTYTVKVSGPAGSVTSGEGVLSVQPQLSFDIGSISPQTAWQGSTLSFLVRSDQLGSGASLSFSVDNPPVGSLTFNPATGYFRFTPAAADKEPFTITFRGILGVNEVAQTVEFQPMPHLPPEEDTLATARPLPDPESRTYIVRSEILSDTPDSLNWVTTNSRSITISGKTIVFQSGHPNHLFDYSGNTDIKEMQIFAEKVIVRSSLKLPQTALTICARELRFEDTSGPDGYASIDCTPAAPTTAAPQFGDGSPGLKGGSLTLHVASFYSDPNHSIRFILSGGRGQAAGIGRDGDAGTDLTTCPSPWPNATYTHEDIVGNDCGNVSTWPGDGDDATPGGKPGFGGIGGDCYGDPISLETISPFVDCTGGQSGAQAALASGGRAGKPNYALHAHKSISGDWYITSQHYAVPGKDAAAPLAYLPIGLSGQFKQSGDSMSWLSPFALRMILANVKDTYISGHFDETKSILNDYLNLVEAYSQSSQWSQLPENWQLDFFALRDEMKGLLHRLDNNLDYFGKPAGWAPLLSFEANLFAFRGEVEGGIRTLYLSYWLTNAANTVTKKVEALNTARDLLRQQIISDEARYADASAEIPNLQATAESITNQVLYLQQQLADIEARLLQRAQQNVEERNKLPEWKEGLGQLSTILKVAPIYQPVLGSIGTGLNLITHYDSSKPLDTLSMLPSLADDFSKGKFNQSVSNYNAFLTNIFYTRVTTQGGEVSFETNNWIESAKNLFQQGKTAYDKYQSLSASLKATEVSDADIRKVLDRIKAEDYEFNAVYDEIADLTVQKELFAQKLADTMQEVAMLSDRMTQNLLAIPGLDRDISQGNAVLDHQALVYVAEMDRRARERLLRYHYYLAKAYEYRMLKPYPGDLNLQGLFDKFRALVQQGKSEVLTSQDFSDLEAVYEEALASVIDEIFTLYNEDPSSVSTAPVRFSLSADELQRLNSPGGSVTINLMEKGLFQPSEENIRIVDIKVGTNLNVHLEGSPAGGVAYFDLYLEHSGVSRLSQDGINYLFRQYATTSPSPVSWGARYDAINRILDPIVPSDADSSLLQALLARKGIPATPNNILLYSRPGAWADIVLTKHDLASSDVQMVIDNLSLEVTYDFTRRSSSLAKLEVLTKGGDLRPYFTLSAVDQTGRQDGVGHFRRTYGTGQTVSIKAPANYGSWAFRRWTDRWGNDLSPAATNRLLQVTLSTDVTVQAEYINLQLDNDSNGIPDWWEIFYFGRTSINPSVDSDGDGLADGDEFRAGTNPMDPSSGLVVQASSETTGRTVTLSWQSVPGKIYRIQAATTLLTGSWQDIGNPIIADEAYSVALVPKDAQLAFYRLLLVQ